LCSAYRFDSDNNCAIPDQTRLGWTAAFGATSYNIKRASATGGPYITVGTVTSPAISYIDTSVEDGSDYFYAVSAVNSSGESSDTEEFGAIAYNGDAAWTNVLTGAMGASWGDAGNWTNSAGINELPDNGNASLSAVGGSYTVNYDSVQPDIKDLVVENTAPYTTDLLISAPLTTLAGSVIRLKGGSSVTVTNGGLWS
jgi:hypothetical protein